jgi:multidrug resistance efflux pump
MKQISPEYRKGFTAKVTTLAYPDKVFMGKVDKVSQVARSG